MSVIEQERSVQQEASIQTRRRAMQTWLKVRSDGIAGGVSGVSILGFVFLQSRDNPLIDQMINSATAGVLGGAAISMIVFLATLRIGSMEERDKAAAQAWRGMRRRIK
ncbi:MAG TPA: hypothetical protein VLF20_00315 [Patescibacteria group bacterium]|nr:hypothetical protein [Patescibacteria group bacterium]